MIYFVLRRSSKLVYRDRQRFTPSTFHHHGERRKGHPDHPPAQLEHHFLSAPPPSVSSRGVCRPLPASWSSPECVVPSPHLSGIARSPRPHSAGLSLRRRRSTSANGSANRTAAAPAKASTRRIAWRSRPPPPHRRHSRALSELLKRPPHRPRRHRRPRLERRGASGQPGHHVRRRRVGQVFETDNVGATWTPIFDKRTSYSVGTVVVDPKNPSTVWVGTGEQFAAECRTWRRRLSLRRRGKAVEARGLEVRAHRAHSHRSHNSDVVYVAAQGPLWSDGGNTVSTKPPTVKQERGRQVMR